MKSVTSLILILILMILGLGFLLSQHLELVEENNALWEEVNRLRQQRDSAQSGQSVATERAESAEAALADKSQEVQELANGLEQLQTMAAICEGRTQELTEALAEQTAAREEAQRQLAAALTNTCPVATVQPGLSLPPKVNSESRAGKMSEPNDPASTATALSLWSTYLPGTDAAWLVTGVLLGMIVVVGVCFGILLWSEYRIRWAQN